MSIDYKGFIGGRKDRNDLTTYMSAHPDWRIRARAQNIALKTHYALYFIPWSRSFHDTNEVGPFEDCEGCRHALEYIEALDAKAQTLRDETGEGR